MIRSSRGMISGLALATATLSACASPPSRFYTLSRDGGSR
jgi:hypothetical protein